MATVINELAEPAERRGAAERLFGQGSQETRVLRRQRQQPLLQLIDEFVGGQVVDAADHEQVAVVDELLDLSRIDVGGLRLNVGPVNLHALVASIREKARPTAEDRGIALALTGDNAATTVFGGTSARGCIDIAWCFSASNFSFIGSISSMPRSPIRSGLPEPHC